MSKKETPNLDKWVRTFKKVGTGTVKIAASTLGSMAPGVTETATSTTEVLRESRTFVSQTRNQIHTQIKNLNRNLTGRNAADILSSAFSDIQSGSFGMDKIADDSFDSLDDFDSSISDINTEISTASDASAVALAESKKNTAILGRTIAEGNVATIQGMQNMTKTLSNVNIKIGNANTAKLSNVMLMGINHMNNGFAGVNNRLDAINANIVSLLDFHRTNTSVLNEQTLQWQSETSQMLHEMGSSIAELHDFVQSQKEIVKPKKESNDFDFTNGFNAKTYVDMVKHNIDNSMIGMAKSMLGMVGTMSSMGGESPVAMLAPELLSMVMPERFKKRVERFDKSFTQSMNNLLYRIGDLSYSTDFIKMTIGQLFGKERESFSKRPKMGTFKRDAMSWNGVAQQTLVEVIPSYLARIESSLTKKEARFYNMDTGKFQTQSKIEEDFSKKFTNSIESSMTKFSSKVSESLSKAGVKGKDADKLQQKLNDIIYTSLVDDSKEKLEELRKKNVKNDDDVMKALRLKYESNRKIAVDGIYNSLYGTLDESTIHDIIMEANSGLNNAVHSMNEAVQNLNSASRNLFNNDFANKHEREAQEARLYKKADIFSGHKFSSTVAWEDITESERRFQEMVDSLKDENSQHWFFNTFMTKLYGPDYESNPQYKKHWEKHSPASRKERKKEKDKALDAKYGKIEGKFDRATNKMYDFISGYDFDNTIYVEPTVSTERPEDFQYPAIIGPNPYAQYTPNVKEAKSEAGIVGKVNTYATKVKSNLNKSIEGLKDRDFKNAMSTSNKKLQSQSKETSKLVHELATTDRSGPSDENKTVDEAIIEHLEDTDNSMKSIAVSLNDNFLSPMVSGLFGKEGFFQKTFSKENLAKLKDSLFNEETGIFKEAGSWFKDQMDYVKYIFTGKAYTNRQNEHFDEKTDSVFDHIANGYDFVYKNTMKYIFGDDYESNETFDKYFKWMDFKGKRDKKREERIQREKEEEEKKVQGNVNENILPDALTTPESSSVAQITINDINDLVEEVKEEDRKVTENVIQSIIEPSKEKPIQSNVSKEVPKESESKSEAVINVISKDEAEEIREEVKDNLVNASEEAAENIVDSSVALIGDMDDKETQDKIQSEQKKATESFFSKFKKWLPKGIAGGIIGAGIGASLGAHGTGLIGSLFLPGGPVGGAVLGVAATILARSDKFQKFMFGEEKDGKRVGGVISNKTQDFVKKNLPLIVGASAIGAVKSIFKSALGFSAVAGGPTGFLLNTLLPGGPIGGAVLGLGVALLKNNERFNKILFGEKNEDGKRDGGILSKGMGTMNKIFSKSGNFIKGGLKGAALGIGSGIAIGKMGIIGSALTATGPIGMGIMGLGLGIASQTDRFKELLFGTEEFDENGKSKGRRKDGLLHKTRNMIVMNILDPLRTVIQENVEEFAYWAKDHIMYPFRAAFGPILDSLASIKKDISDAVHDVFNNFAETLGNAIKTGLKQVFSPLTKAMSFVGNTLIKGTRIGVQMALSPLTSGLKLLQLATSKMRKRAKKEENKTIRSHLGTIFKGVIQATGKQWAEDDRDYGDGIGGKINKFLTHGRDIFQNTKQGFDAAHAAYRDELKEQGYNHLGWMNIEDEKKMDKINHQKLVKDRKRWKEIDKVRNEVAKENDSGEAYYSNEGLKAIQKRFKKAGLDPKLIRTNEDLNNLLYNKTDFIDELKGKKKKDEAIIKDSKATQNFYGRSKDYFDTTEKYQSAVMAKFDFITKNFTKFAAQQALEKKRNIDLQDLTDIDKDLRSKGLTWKDLDIDPSRLVNLNTISEKDWDKYMDEKFRANDLRSLNWEEIDKVRKKYADDNNNEEYDKEKLSAEKFEDIQNDLKEAGLDPKKYVNDVSELNRLLYKKDEFISYKDDESGFADMVQAILERKEAEETKKESTENTENAAIINSLDNLNKTTEANMRMSMSQQAIETGSSESEVEEAAGFDANTKTFKLATLLKKRQDKAARDKREAEESEAARTGAKQLDENGNEIDEANIIDVKFKDDKDKKSTVFGSISSFFSNALGAIGSFFTSPSLWKTVGISTVIAAIFGTKIKEWGTKLLDFLSPVLSFLKEKVPEVLQSAGEWLNEHGESIVSTMVDNFCDNSDFIFTNIAKILYSAISTLGKHIAAKIADIFPWLGKKLGWTTDESTKYQDYGTDESAATEAANEQDKNLYYDSSDGNYKILSSDQYVDENGNITHVEAGGTGMRQAIYREGLQFVRSATNRKLAKTTLSGAWKVASFLPGKVAKGAAKVTVGAAKGVVGAAELGVKGVNAGVNAIKNKAAKNAVKEGSEAIVETTVKDAAENLTETVVKEGSEAVIEKGTKTLAEEATEKVAKEALENVAESTAEQVAKKKSIKGFINTAVTKISGAANTVSDWIGSTKFVTWVKKMGKSILEKMENSNSKMLNKIAEKINTKIAEATGKTAADATIILGLGFGVYDAVNGALSAAYLFGVSQDNVTTRMKLVSSILSVLLGTAVGAWIDILLEVWHLITGQNAKQWMARMLYEVLGGDSQYLEDSITELEAETAKYNSINNTNITSSEYNELKNGNLTIGARVKNLWGKITGKSSSTDYSIYAVSDSELEAYKKQNSITDTSTATVGTSAYDDYDSYDFDDYDYASYTGDEILNGPGRAGVKSKYAVGYGRARSQSDPRWANYPIGKFPDGTTSTMATGGCGPTALSMVAEGFGASTDPLGVASYAKQNGYMQDGGATSDLFTKGASGMGLTASTVNKSNLKSKLASGESVIVSGKSSTAYGPFTEAGHVVVADGLDRNGKAIVRDPMRGETRVDTSDLTNGMTHGWSYSKSVGYGSGSNETEYWEYNGKKWKRTYTAYGHNFYGELNGTETNLVKLDSFPADFGSTKYKSTFDSSGNVVEISQEDRNKLAGIDTTSTNKSYVQRTTETKYFEYNGKYYRVDTLYGKTIYSEISSIGSNFVKISVPYKFYSSDTYKEIKKQEASSTSSASTSNSSNYSVLLSRSTLKTEENILNKINKGYLQTNGVYKFNTYVFYSGLNVADLKVMAHCDSRLLSDSAISGFQIVYQYYVSSNNFNDESVLNLTKVKELLTGSDLGELLGGTGYSGDFEYKYGFPFFQTDDQKWADISWREADVKSRGGDLASLAMVSTAFAPNILTPKYIYDEWLKKYPTWWTSSNGLDMDKVFTDGGYNALTSTQVDGQRVQANKVTEVSNPSSILSALKLNKPVVLTGYRYDGSIFGGSYNKSTAPTSSKDDYATIVARAANDTNMAVLDPFTTLDQNGIFSTNLLTDKVGPKNTPVLKSAYIISGPNGEGADTPVDLSVKAGGNATSDYTDISSVSGLEKIAAIFKNIAAIGSHLFEYLLSDDENKQYRSIMDESYDVENEGEDDIGVGYDSNGEEQPVYNVMTNSYSSKSSATIESLLDSYLGKETSSNPLIAAAVDTTLPASLRSGTTKKVTTTSTGKRKYFIYAGDKYEVLTKNGKPFYVRFTGDVKNFEKVNVPSDFSVNGSNTMVFKNLEDTFSSNASAKAKATTEAAKTFSNTTANINKTKSESTSSEADIASMFNVDSYTTKSVTGYGIGDGSMDLTASQKISAIGNAYLASMLGEDYETAKQKYLDSYSSTSSDDTDTSTSTATTTSAASTSNSAAIGTNTVKSVVFHESAGISKDVPSGFGKAMPYMGWSMITYKDSDQYKLRSQYEGYDSNGLGKIGSRYVVAVKPYYGSPGDLIDVKFEDGSMLRAIIGDEKGKENEPGGSQYYNTENKKQREMGVTDRVHTDTSVVEYLVNKEAGIFNYYGGTHSVRDFHPEWAKNISTITNVGNVWDKSYGIGKLKSVGYYGPLSKTKAVGYGDTWLSIVAKVKAAIAEQKLGYSQSGYITININGVSRKNRRDCSGFVSLCVSYYTGKDFNATSYDFCENSNTALENAGFKRMQWYSWNYLKAGDIIARSGHVEIFAGNENGKHLVYNCGSTSSCNTPGTTVTGNSKFTTVWRPSYAGTVSSSTIDTSVGTYTSTATDDEAVVESSDPLDPISNIFKTIGDKVDTIVENKLGTNNVSFGPGSDLNTPEAWFTNTLGGSVTSEYGARSSSLGNEYHRGIDIGAPSGRDIYSPIDGQLVSKGNDVAGYGNYAVVRDQSGNNHIFAHMNNSVGYGIGDQISKNDVIGQVGSTGNSTGNHLHYEIRRNENKYSAIDPSTFKYDSNVGKSMNIQKVNTTQSEKDSYEERAVGSGSKDISAKVQEKLNVAIDSTNIEDKMDTMIEALQIMATNSSKPVPATSNTVTNNTTTNVSYGSGKTKTTKKSSSSSKSSKSDSNESLTLAEIHKQIALRD